LICFIPMMQRRMNSLKEWKHYVIFLLAPHLTNKGFVIMHTTVNTPEPKAAS